MIRNLYNTIWELNEELTLLIPTETSLNFSINFKSNEDSYSSFTFYSNALVYGATTVYSTQADDPWVLGETYRTITIIDGQDVTNSNLINWLTANAIFKGRNTGMKYTKIPTTTASTMQFNAGIIVDSFTPSTGAIGNILAASTGGFTFATNPTYADFGEDIDNVPANTWQFKRVSYYDPAISGTFVTLTPALAKQLSGAGAVSDTTHFTPSHTLVEADFDDIWLIGDYSDKNSSASGGSIAIHLMNALNNAGFQWTTTKDGKGQFAFDFHGHYDYTDMDVAPFEIYVKAGT